MLQANRFLDLLQKYLDMKAARMDAVARDMSSVDEPSTSGQGTSHLDFGRWLSDWHYRKRYLMRLAGALLIPSCIKGMHAKLMPMARRSRVALSVI